MYSSCTRVRVKYMQVIVLDYQYLKFIWTWPVLDSLYSKVSRTRTPGTQYSTPVLASTNRVHIKCTMYSIPLFNLERITDMLSISSLRSVNTAFSWVTGKFLGSLSILQGLVLARVSPLGCGLEGILPATPSNDPVLQATAPRFSCQFYGD